MEAWLVDWLNLLGRWLHFIAGIAWIGSSFYFIWLDNHLKPPVDPAEYGRQEALRRQPVEDSRGHDDLD